MPRITRIELRTKLDRVYGEIEQEKQILRNQYPNTQFLEIWDEDNYLISFTVKLRDLYQEADTLIFRIKKQSYKI